MGIVLILSSPTCYAGIAPASYQSKFPLYFDVYSLGSNFSCRSRLCYIRRRDIKIFVARWNAELDLAGIFQGRRPGPPCRVHPPAPVALMKTQESCGHGLRHCATVGGRVARALDPKFSSSRQQVLFSVPRSRLSALRKSYKTWRATREDPGLCLFSQ